VLCFVLLMLLIGQLGVPVHIRAQAQVSLVPSPKRILILYSCGDGIPAYQKATPAFRSVMTAGGVRLDDMFFEYLDLQRKNDPEYRRKLADLLRHKYGRRKIDLIVTLHTPVLSFLANEGKGVFPEAPSYPIWCRQRQSGRIARGTRSFTCRSTWSFKELWSWRSICSLKPGESCL
jgi:hypothetical protein